MLGSILLLALFATVHCEYKYIKIGAVDGSFPCCGALPFDTALKHLTGALPWQFKPISLNLTYEAISPDQWKNHLIVHAYLMFDGGSIPATTALVKEKVEASEYFKDKDVTVSENFLPAPADCHEIYEAGQNQTYALAQSGIYWLGAKDGIEAYCDMENKGWTLIHNHADNNQSFHLKTSAEYQNFFGDLTASHWLGLDAIAALTAQQSYQLRVDLEDCDGNNNYIIYEDFQVSDASENYKLNLTLPKDDPNYFRNPPGDSMYNPMYYIVGDKGTTPETDQFSQLGNAFSSDGTNGGWWFNDIYAKRYNLANLNGKLAEDCKGSWPDGLIWNTWHGPKVAMKSASMKIRPAEAKYL